MPELDQPLMVVVLVVIARNASTAGVAGLFGGNRRAANMGDDCNGWGEKTVLRKCHRITRRVCHHVANCSYL